MQAALWFYNLSALVLIALTARKRISLLASSDQMALPSGLPQAFREKGLTQILCFVLICADFLIWTFYFLFDVFSDDKRVDTFCTDPFAFIRYPYFHFRQAYQLLF